MLPPPPEPPLGSYVEITDGGQLTITHREAFVLGYRLALGLLCDRHASLRSGERLAALGALKIFKNPILTFFDHFGHGKWQNGQAKSLDPYAIRDAHTESYSKCTLVSISVRKKNLTFFAPIGSKKVEKKVGVSC